MMLEVIFTRRFKKDLKKLKSSKRNEDDLIQIIEIIANHRELPLQARDHVLIGNYAGCRECHIAPDWLLIYQVTDMELILLRTGSHSELFS